MRVVKHDTSCQHIWWISYFWKRLSHWMVLIRVHPAWAPHAQCKICCLGQIRQFWWHPWTIFPSFWGESSGERGILRSQECLVGRQDLHHFFNREHRDFLTKRFDLTDTDVAIIISTSNLEMVPTCSMYFSRRDVMKLLKWFTSLA